jgi:hypothetical protein
MYIDGLIIMANLSDHERLNLKKLVTEMEGEDNTHNIRKVKHSVPMRNDIRTMDTLKTAHSEMRRTKPDEFKSLCQSQCNFLYNNYTDIFNKMISDELDLTIMTKLLTVLKLIEDGKTDQHEGSVMVGKLLKELYVDSAVKRINNLDKEHEGEHVEENVGKTISWRDFKNMK